MKKYPPAEEFTQHSTVNDLSLNTEYAGCAGNSIYELDPLKYTARPSTSVCSFKSKSVKVDVVDRFKSNEVFYNYVKCIFILKIF